MKRNLRLLLPILSILLTLACLGTPKPTGMPVSTPTVTSPSSSAVPTSTALPAQLAGLKIAYILDGNIWLWEGSTPARQLTNNGDALQIELSDDGEIIAYRRIVDMHDSLWAVNTDNSKSHLLVDITSYADIVLPLGGTAVHLDQIKFKIGTHIIYFNTYRAGDGFNRASNDLHSVDADSPNPQALLASGAGQFTFSPDGNSLALSSLTSIKVIHADGSGLVTALSYPVISTMVDYIPQVVWLSDGTGFYTAIPNDDGGKSKYLFVSAGGNFSAQLAEYEGSILVISPDGLKIAYSNLTANIWELHIIEASTTDTIIASYEGAPLLVPWGWSQDSKLVTFSNAHPVLLLTAGIGIPPSPLTESVTPYSLRWVSADRFIFFREGELLIGQINNPETISIASGFANDQSDTKHYDFTINPPP